jgi:hypothetical protein
MSEVRYLTTGYVSTGRKGPLTVTAVTDSELIVVDVPFKTHEVSAQLARGAALEEVLAGLPSVNKSETRIPIARIQTVRWVSSQHDFRVAWQDGEGRTRNKTAYVSRNVHRTELVEQLESLLGHTFHHQQAPAGVLRIAWSQFVGALVALFGTMFLVIFWDPQVAAAARGGWIAILLGPTGCALVGAAIGGGCLVAAWRRLHPRPIEYRWTA